MTRPAEPQSASKMATLVEEGMPEQAMRACALVAQEGSSMMGRGGEAGSCRERASEQAGGWVGRQACRGTCGQGSCPLQRLHQAQRGVIVYSPCRDWSRTSRCRGHSPCIRLIVSQAAMRRQPEMQQAQLRVVPPQ